MQISVVGNRVLTTLLLALSKCRGQSVLADASDVGGASLTVLQAENTTLFRTNRTLSPANVVRATLTGAARIVA